MIFVKQCLLVESLGVVLWFKRVKRDIPLADLEKNLARDFWCNWTNTSKFCHNRLPKIKFSSPRAEILYWPIAQIPD